MLAVPSLLVASLNLGTRLECNRAMYAFVIHRGASGALTIAISVKHSVWILLFIFDQPMLAENTVPRKPAEFLTHEYICSDWALSGYLAAAYTAKWDVIRGMDMVHCFKQ